MAKKRLPRSRKSWAARVRRIQALVARYVAPGRSLSKELLAERRGEIRRESKGGRG